MWRVEGQAAVSDGKCTQELLSLGERKFIGGLRELQSTLSRDTVTTELKTAFPPNTRHHFTDQNGLTIESFWHQ
jgi:hypothetical protein